MQPVTETISPEQQIANVQEVLLRFVRRLHDYWGITMRDARKMTAWSQSCGSGLWRLDAAKNADCWAAVAALDHWRELKRLHRRGLLKPIVDDGLPF